VQITSLLFLPDFPGWIAPLHFNPVRFEELLIFIFTLCVSWVSACGILGGYKTVATSGERFCTQLVNLFMSNDVIAFDKRAKNTYAADLPTALARVSGAWLIAMPVAACNLILVTAAEGNDLVGDSFFGHVLPLAARGAYQALSSHESDFCSYLYFIVQPCIGPAGSITNLYAITVGRHRRAICDCCWCPGVDGGMESLLHCLFGFLECPHFQ
jgi:hypothetical protein